MNSPKKRAKKITKRSPKPVPLIALAGLLILVVLITVGGLVLRGVNSSAARLRDEITVEEAFAMRQAGAFILDVRTPEEWNEYHVPDSTLIPLDQLEDRLGEVPRDQEIVVVCRSGNRSREGRDILRKAGFTRVTSMAGGLKQWQSAGYPIVSGP